MKKLVSILLFFAMCFGLTVVGCGQGTHCDEQRTKVDGKYYSLSHAYDNGYIGKEQLKSIACHYYEVKNYEENPYLGFYIKPTEELVEEVEKELKQAYLEQIENTPDGLAERIKIIEYYGTYDNNVLVNIRSDYFTCDIVNGKDTEIGGIIFDNYLSDDIRVYHKGEDNKQPVEVNGKHYMLHSAYAEKLLTEQDLKSISCAYYERLNFEYPNNDFGENQYSGAYIKPTGELTLQMRNEIKQAFINQMEKSVNASIYDIEISCYYGTYNGNAVISIKYKGTDWVWGQPRTDIGGVVFTHYSDGCILLYQK